ncbi:MAG: hypothetical protein ACTSRW_08630 [Candidatus Helarchaeota archaeon]
MEEKSLNFGDAIEGNNFELLKKSLIEFREIAKVVEKDFAGVRLRSPDLLQKKEIQDQINRVIEKIQEDLDIVENGMPKLKIWFMIRRQALNSIQNLGESIEQAVKCKTEDEIIDALRMFALAAQEDFSHQLVRLQEIWSKDVFNIMQAMKRCVSIMQVVQEKIDRYKEEIHMTTDLSNDIERALKFIISKNFDAFTQLEEKLRTEFVKGE